MGPSSTLLYQTHCWILSMHIAKQIDQDHGENSFVVQSSRTSSSSFPSSEVQLLNENKAMTFLRKIGKVGGTANRDFTFAIGIDEGPSTNADGDLVRGGGGGGGGSGMAPQHKAKAAFASCITTGLVDNMTETFPQTSCGTQWTAFTDRVMGGHSMAHIERELWDGRRVNVLRGTVRFLPSSDNDDDKKAGFVQMAANLAMDDTGTNVGGISSSYKSTVDASMYDGLELDLQCKGQEGDQVQSFNVHLKTNSCLVPFSSYRASFALRCDQWSTVRLPWTDFQGHGPGAVDQALDCSVLQRAGIVAIGGVRERDVVLGVARIRFYSENDNEQGRSEMDP